MKAIAKNAEVANLIVALKKKERP